MADNTMIQTQRRWYDFLGAITSTKEIMRYRDIIPYGLYSELQYELNVNDFTLLPGFKFVLPSGMVVEQVKQKIVRNYPEISAGTKEDYTLVAYRSVSMTTEQDATVVNYSFVKGYYQQSNIVNIPIELRLSKQTEFLIMGHLTWDGKKWSFLQVPKTAISKNQTVLIPPFPYSELLNRGSDFGLQIDNDFGPVFGQSRGECEILTGYSGVIDNMTLRCGGSGEIRVKLLPEAYSYTQSFQPLDSEKTYVIQTSTKMTPTKANTGIQFRFQGEIKLISLAIN